MSTRSDSTLPFEDHSATDRKGVPLDFTAPPPLPALLLARGMLSTPLTRRWPFSPRVFLPFYSFPPCFPPSTRLVNPPLDLPRLDRAWEKLYVIMILWRWCFHEHSLRADYSLESCPHFVENGRIRWSDLGTTKAALVSRWGAANRRFLASNFNFHPMGELLARAIIYRGRSAARLGEAD